MMKSAKASAGLTGSGQRKNWPVHTPAMSNVIYKVVRAGAPAWQKRAEEHAATRVPFVVRPFKKGRDWPFLEELSERFELVVKFSALEQAAYFD